MAIQLAFPFAWPAYEIYRIADKHMSIPGGRYGQITVHRSTRHYLWVVSRDLTHFGALGVPAGSYFYMYPHVFFTGRSVWRFVRSGWITLATPLSIVWDG